MCCGVTEIAPSLTCRQEAYSADPVVDGDDDDIPRDRQVLSGVHIGHTEQVGTTVDPHHDWEVTVTEQWHHNEHDGVSYHQPHDWLLNRLFRHGSKNTTKLRVTGLCGGIHRWPVNSPHKGPVTRQMFPFDDVIMGLVQERRNSSSLTMELHLSCINPSIWICRFTTIGVPMMKIKRSWHHVFLIIGIPIPGNKVYISKRGPAAYYPILGVYHVEKT